MRKSDMTSKQLLERNQIAEVLSASGWQEEKTNDFFNRDFWVNSELAMNYENKDVQLSIQYFAERRRITFTFENASKRLDFVIEYLDKVQQLLDIIIDSQDEISFSNFKHYLRRILEVSEKIYLVRDDELVPLKE